MRTDNVTGFLLLTYLLLIVLASPLIDFGSTLSWHTLFSALLLLSFPALLLLPAWILWRTAALLHWSHAAQRGILWLASSSAALFLFADVRLFDLYGFHVNGFVLNLIMTPGGIESLGASATPLYRSVTVRGKGCSHSCTACMVATGTPSWPTTAVPC